MSLVSDLYDALAVEAAPPTPTAPAEVPLSLTDLAPKAGCSIPTLKKVIEANGVRAFMFGDTKRYLLSEVLLAMREPANDSQGRKAVA
ncbi:MAG: hypothetical protein JNK04_08305 [Myxococcales bacterium]|nr:hypothetical protein [Myxococcales bacterium]